MRFFILAVVIAFITQNIQAQAVSDTLPDVIQLSKKDIQKIYRNKEDTLGFRRLTSETSLKQYKGKENRHIRRTLRSIKSNINSRDIIYNKIANTDIYKLSGGDTPRLEEQHILRSPKYRLTKSGIMLIGSKDYLAPWNDMITKWETLNYYFIDYDKNVKLIQSISVNRYGKEPKGIIEFIPEELIFKYPGIATDSVTIQIPPGFEKGMEELKKYIEENVAYHEWSVEEGVQGKVSVSFTVNPDKSFSDIKIITAIDPFLEKAAIKAIKQMDGMWLAGTVNGKEIPVEVVLRVRFYIIRS